MSRPKSEIMRRLRLGNLRTLLRARCGHTLPDDDAGREYLWDLLLPVSLSPEAECRLRNTIETWAPWMDVKERFELVAQIERTPAYVRKVKPRTLGERLRVTAEERERLKLWTIIPFDLTAKELADQREAKKRARDRRRRRDAGSKPRTDYEAASINRAKPWLALGISRATWYRRRETSPRQVNLLISRAHTCLTEKTARPQGVGAQERGEDAAPCLLARQPGQRALGADLSQPAPHTSGGGLTARVWIRVIGHPAVKSGPADLEMYRGARPA
jgi:hypothetical protein